MRARLKIITVDPQEMWKALSTTGTLQPLFEGESIPAGAVICGINVDFNHGPGLGRVSIKLQHPSFPIVLELEEIEKVAMGYRKSKGGGK